MRRETCYNRSWLLPQCKNHNFCQQFVSFFLKQPFRYTFYIFSFVNIDFGKILKSYLFFTINFCHYIFIFLPQNLNNIFCNIILAKKQILCFVKYHSIDVRHSIVLYNGAQWKWLCVCVILTKMICVIFISEILTKMRH